MLIKWVLSRNSTCLAALVKEEHTRHAHPNIPGVQNRSAGKRDPSVVGFSRPAPEKKRTPLKGGLLRGG